MNITAIEYLNKANQDHQKAYNNYIKDCLLSSKPIELSMKDFLPKKHYKRKVNNNTNQNQTEYKMTIEDVLYYAQNMFNIYQDEQKRAEKEGNKEKAFECWKRKQPYEILICKITGREYICNIPR